MELDQDPLEMDNEESEELLFDSKGRLCLNDNIDELDETTNTTRDDEEDENANDSRAHWTRMDILALLRSYKEQYALFRSSTVRNVDAWRRVAEDVPGYRPTQCRAKFKYLKSLYTKRKECILNGDIKRSRAVFFEYFDEFEDIFHGDHIALPMVTVSSSSTEKARGIRPRRTKTEVKKIKTDFSVKPENSPVEDSAYVISVESPDDRESSSTRRLPRRKRTRLEIQLERFQRNMEIREQARERRMVRFLQQQELCTNRICDMIQKFIDKI